MRHCNSKANEYPDDGVYPEFEDITKDPRKQCDICHRWVKRITYHKRTHHSEQSRKFVCDICDFETDRKDTLSTHQYLKHKMINRKFSKLDETFKDGQTQYECFECKKIFDDLTEIENHMLLRSCEEFQQKKNLTNLNAKNVEKPMHIREAWINMLKNVNDEIG